MGRYPFPWDRFIGLALALPSGQRSFVDDCQIMVQRMQPPPRVIGVSNIPLQGPLVLAANHYQRRGLWIGWPGAVITASVAEVRGPEPPLHWLVTGGLRWCQSQRQGSEIPLAQTIFQRVARVYGMAALPLEGTAGRARAVRSWLDWTRRGEAVGIFPEGLRGRSDGLQRPEAGYDTLCHVLAARGIPTQPCAIQEVDEVLTVTFGVPAVMRSADEVMVAVARLLPPQLRGVYDVRDHEGPTGPDGV